MKMQASATAVVETDRNIPNAERQPNTCAYITTNVVTPKDDGKTVINYNRCELRSLEGAQVL